MKAGKLQIYFSKLGEVVFVKIISATPSVPLSVQENANLQFKEAIMKSLEVCFISMRCLIDFKVMTLIMMIFCTPVEESVSDEYA